MKKCKFTLLSVLMALIVFTSCTNNESAFDEQQTTEESQSITNSLNRLIQQFDANGNLVTDANPTGNLVFDFCFEFVYPLTLSYNNGTIVTVNSEEDLVIVMLNSTSSLYINGIAFPFNVEVFNEDTNTIEIGNINNEEEFVNLLVNCDFDNNECICTQQYDPVCVEITDAIGETQIITFSNACMAECEGFAPPVFLECENNNGCTEADIEAFILECNTWDVTINGEDYEFTFSEGLGSGGILVIDPVSTNGPSNDGGWYFSTDSSGNPILIIDTNNSPLNFYDEWSIVNCNNSVPTFESNNNIIEITYNCNEDNTCTEAIIEPFLLECPWLVSNGSTYTFNQDGTVVLTDGTYSESGPWNMSTNANGEITVTMMQNGSNYSDTWVFSGCVANEIFVNSFLQVEIEQNCD